MTFVMDASIAASWCFPDESSPTANRAFELISREAAFVPAHWWFELRNVLVVGERRQRIDAQQVGRFLELIADLPVEIDNSPNERLILTLARRHRLTFYDAAYLELALRHEALATLDDELLRAAEREGVALV
jgi:predicted nucleic acid-binding protein